MEADFLMSCDNSSTEIEIRRTDRKALIDTEDLKLVAQYNWVITAEGYIQGYVTGNGKATKLHRFIMEAHGHNIEGKPIDHANHDKFDNRKSNLRVCTTAQNVANSLKPITNTSGYKGVIQRQNKDRWIARIKINNRSIDLGAYKSAEEAARAYDIAAIAQWGEFAYTNNIDTSVVPVRCLDQHTAANISDEKVVELRKIAATKVHTYKELAAMFGISNSYCWEIVNYKKR